VEVTVYKVISDQLSCPLFYEVFLKFFESYLAATIAPNSIIFANDVPGLHFTALEKVEKTSTIKLYLQNLINFAGSQNFPLADAYHPSLDGQEGNRLYINANDNIHPSGPGGELFCGIVAKAISDHNMVR